MISSPDKLFRCVYVVAAAWIMSLSAIGSVRAGEFDAYIGTYTGGESEGIYHFVWNSDSGTAGDVRLALKADNPSFLALRPDGKNLYAVLETGEWNGVSNSGGMLAASRGEDGSLKLLNSSPTYGAAPCHLEVDPTGKYVFYANYTGGSIGCFSIESSGKLGELSGFVQYNGSSINRRRQEASHAHSIHLSPDGRFVLSADLGMDCLHVHQFDATNGILNPHGTGQANVRPGGGPRHFAFHSNGKTVFVLNELTSRVTTMKFNPRNARLQVVDEDSTLPEDSSVSNSTAEIVVHPNGTFVYASNRGHDSIAAFRFDEGSNSLSRLSVHKTGGKTPRNFAIDPSGRWLLAASQNSGFITIFSLDSDSGKLEDTGRRIAVPTPVCVRFAKR